MTTRHIKYKRLNISKPEIRLLELAPAQSLDEPVVCRLITVPLNDDLEFLALSSLYGDHSETEKVFVDGVPIVLTAHLAQALRHMRAVFFPTLLNSARSGPSQRPQKRGPRWLLHLLRHVSSILPDPELEARTPLRLWLDMLCVNPADERERSRQVLARIYGSAKMVVGWLGLKSEFSDDGLKVLRAIDEAMPRNWGEPGDKELHPENYSPQHRWAKKVQHFWMPTEEGVNAFTLPHWVGANDFMDRPYFQRRWILEEIALARFPAFLIGDDIVSWKQVLRSNRLQEEFRSYPSDLFPPCLRAQIVDVPLGTVHALCDEFARRQRMEMMESRNSTQSSSSTRSTSTK
ncbi:hypothetical protein DL771_003082 [Monosporascus sp. 5C6A]|nr:hypothetical protein DL771_003082 [Monosporascus sp. 5C6A]